MINKELKKKQGIYVLKIQNKTYIGSSINLYHRIYIHFYDLRKNKHHSSYLQNVVNKYGIENLSYDILEYTNVSDVELRRKEEYYINLHNSEFNSRNPFSYVLPEEICLQIGKTLSDKYLNNELIIWNKGTGRKFNVYDFYGNLLNYNIDTEEIVKIYTISNRSVINNSLRSNRYWLIEFKIILIPINEKYEDYINKCIKNRKFLRIPIFYKNSENYMEKCNVITTTRLLKKIIISDNFIYYSKQSKKHYSFIGKNVFVKELPHPVTQVKELQEVYKTINK